MSWVERSVAGSLACASGVMGSIFSLTGARDIDDNLCHVIVQPSGEERAVSEVERWENSDVVQC